MRYLRFWPVAVGFVFLAGLSCGKKDEASAGSGGNNRAKEGTMKLTSPAFAQRPHPRQVHL